MMSSEIKCGLMITGNVRYLNSTDSKKIFNLGLGWMPKNSTKLSFVVFSILSD